MVWTRQRSHCPVAAAITPQVIGGPASRCYCPGHDAYILLTDTVGLPGACAAARPVWPHAARLAAAARGKPARAGAAVRRIAAPCQLPRIGPRQAQSRDGGAAHDGA